MTRVAWTSAWSEIALVGTILVLAALIRGLGVNYPPQPVLDEAWYARDGCYYWTASAESCGMANLLVPDRDVDRSLASFGELTPEHPPFAKSMIGLPMTVFGFVPGAWRVAPVVAGVLTVAFLYVLTRRAFGSRTIAAAGATLLALDYPHIVHSRMAMLEIFVGLFAVAAFYFCALDSEQVSRRVDGRPAHYGWRLAAGVAGGAAAASKLSGAAIVVGVLALIAAWEVSAHRRTGRRPGALGPPALSILALLVIVPVAVYAAAYVGRLDAPLIGPSGAGAQSWLALWLERQAYMIGFHASKPAAAAVPWALPMTENPVPYVFERTDAGVRQILLFANPVLWWGGFAAVGVAAIRCVRGHRRAAAALVLVAFVTSYATWLSVAITGRPTHLFYAVPIAPFLYFALAFVAVDVVASRAGRWAVVALVATAGIAFAFYMPIIIAQEIEYRQWVPRACSAYLLSLAPVDGCGLPPGGET